MDLINGNNMLTAVVITKNEENMIVDCLKSLSFANEIIVVDNNSSDKTAFLAKKFNAKVVAFSGEGFDAARSVGMQNSRFEWLLYLDADERVSPQLARTIINIMKLNKRNYGAFEISRKNIYLGKQMQFGGWGNDSVIRFFRKSQLLGWTGSLHEQPKFKGNLGIIIDPIVHYSHRDLFSMVEKTIIFTNYEASNRFAARHPPVVGWRIFRMMFTEFWHRFMKLSAWRDGTEGVIDGLFQIYNTFIIYSRLWELQHDQNSSNI